MNVVEAFKKVKDEGVMAYRQEWRNAPLLDGMGIVWIPSYGYCYWYANAPMPDKYADDDPRIGVTADLLRIADVMAEDWEIEETWKVVKRE